jgi:altronate dehydratase
MPGHAPRPAVLLLDPADTVAVALATLEPGTPVEVVRAGSPVALSAAERIPFGHKVALVGLRAGDPVLKYGEVIGYATAPIRPGQHVHVHNVRSDRAGAGEGGRVRV